MSNNLENLVLVLPDIANAITAPTSVPIVSAIAANINNTWSMQTWLATETITVKYTLRGRYGNGRAGGTIASPISNTITLNAGEIPQITISYLDLIGVEGIDLWMSLDTSGSLSDQSFRHVSFIAISSINFRNNISLMTDLVIDLPYKADIGCSRSLAQYLASQNNSQTVYQYMLAAFGTQYATEGHLMKWNKEIEEIEFLGFKKRLIKSRDVIVGIQSRYTNAREFLRQANLAGGKPLNDYYIEYGSNCECLQYFGMEGDIAGDSLTCANSSKVIRFYIPNLLAESIEGTEWQLINGSKADVNLSFASDINDIVGNKGLCYFIEE